MTKSLEDYLESIYFLGLEKKIIRVSDIARRLKVSNASVNNAIKELLKLGYIEHIKYAYVELTESGLEVSKKIASKHHLLKRFFKNVLHVSEKNAEQDACSIEHFISEESLERLIEFLDLYDPKEACTIASIENLDGLHNKVKPLDKVQPGKKVKVFKVACAECLKKRMLDLGLLEDDEIEIVKNEKSLPLILKIKGCNMVLGRGICSKILVVDDE